MSKIQFVQNDNGIVLAVGATRADCVEYVHATKSYTPRNLRIAEVGEGVINIVWQRDGFGGYRGFTFRTTDKLPANPCALHSHGECTGDAGDPPDHSDGDKTYCDLCARVEAAIERADDWDAGTYP
jgi:hypothetical protein